MTEPSTIAWRRAGVDVRGPVPATTPPGTWADPQRHVVAGMTHPWYRLVGELFALVAEATHDFYRQRGIRPAVLPVTTGAATSPMGHGSDSLPVEVEVLGRRAYLADSMQFHLEYALRMGHAGVYYVMPCFRGEDPDATHLNEFFHSEAEISGSLHDCMQLVTGYVRALAGAVCSSAAAGAVGAVAGGLDHLRRVAAAERFAEITYADALDVLGRTGPGVRPTPLGLPVITRAGEQRLLREAGDPLWLTEPPELLVPFYQATDGATARAADLLMGSGEVAGCGERHATGDGVRRGLERHQVDAGPYGWYVRMKDELPLRSAGFGLGIERFLMWVLRHGDIRDLQILPRLKGHEVQV